MLKHYELPACSVEVSLILMGDRWKILIVHDLLTEKTLNGFHNNICVLPVYDENRDDNRNLIF